MSQKRRHHIELIRIHRITARRLPRFVFLETWKILDIVPLDLANLLSCLGFKVSVFRHSTKDEKTHMLLAHCDVDFLNILLILGDKARGANVKACLLPHLSNGAVQVLLIFVDLASRKAPACAFLPAPNQDNFLHALIHHDSATHRHSHLVRQKLLVGLQVLFAAEPIK